MKPTGLDGGNFVMGKKKDTYVELLKEAVAANEYDSSVLTFKGPYIDDIIGFDGNNELQTHKNVEKDVTNVLERRYYKERLDKPIKLVQEEDVQEEEPEENDIETGDDPDDVDDTMDDLEGEITDDEDGFFDAEYVTTNEAAVEDAVIRQLIREMEGEADIEPKEEDETQQAGTDEVTEKEVKSMLDRAEDEGDLLGEDDLFLEDDFLFEEDEEKEDKEEEEPAEAPGRKQALPVEKLQKRLQKEKKQERKKRI